MLLAGVLIFSIASLVSGFAPTPLMLIIFRAFQRLGAAFLTPAALSIITTTYTGAQRSSALAAWGAIGGAGAAAGVLMRGVVTSFLGWQWVFFINVPMGLVGAALTTRLVPGATTRAARFRELDLIGAITQTGGMVLLVYSIEGTAANGWASPGTLVPFGLASALLAGFLVLERLVLRPPLPPATWRNRSLLSGVGMMVGVSGLMCGAFFLNSLYLQGVLGATALQAGLAFFPFAVVITAASHLGSRLLAHVSTRSLLVLGLLATAGGLRYWPAYPTGQATSRTCYQAS